jgi:hypothetical protein
MRIANVKSAPPKRDGFKLNRHRALAHCLRMISAQTRPAFVVRENRYAPRIKCGAGFFRIMR